MSGVCRLSCTFHSAGNSPPDEKGAIPASTCTLSKFVGLMQREMIRQQSWRAGFRLRACVDLVHTGQAYSAAEYQKARHVCMNCRCLATPLRVCAFADDVISRVHLHLCLVLSCTILCSTAFCRLSNDSQRRITLCVL